MTTFSCEEQEVIKKNIDPVSKSQKEISDLMTSLGYSTTPNKEVKTSRSAETSTSEQIIEILLSNGFELTENPELYDEILLESFNNSNSRVEGCSHTILDIDGDGITGTVLSQKVCLYCKKGFPPLTS